MSLKQTDKLLDGKISYWLHHLSSDNPDFLLLKQALDAYKNHEYIPSIEKIYELAEMADRKMPLEVLGIILHDNMKLLEKFYSILNKLINEKLHKNYFDDEFLLIDLIRLFAYVEHKSDTVLLNDSERRQKPLEF